MPKWLIELTDGRKFEVEADAQPTEADVLGHLSATPARPARAEDYIPQAPPQTAGRFLSEAWNAIKPWDRPSDIWEGPAYVARNPLDSINLLYDALKGASADQLTKAGQAKARMQAAPTLGGKLMAASEMLGHGAGAIPIIGPAAATAGEAIASGDITGGAGRATGLVTSAFAPKAISAAGQPVRTAVANRMTAGNVSRIEQALAATTNENKARAARVAPEMLQRRVWNRDLAELQARAETQSARAGKDVEAAVSAVANREVDVLPLVDELEKVKASAVDTNAAGQRVIIEPDQVKAIERIQDTLMDYGDRISLGSLNKVRLKWDEVVQSSKGFTNPDVGWKAWAAREGRTVLRDELGKASPDIDRVMAEYSFWQNIEDVAAATNRRRVGQSGGLMPTIAGAGGAVVMEAAAPGSGMATKLGAAALGGQLAANLRRLLSSPGYQMFNAIQRQRLADALASGQVDRIGREVGRGLAVIGAVQEQRRTVSAQDPAKP